jgi:hypothetical protein
MTLAEFSDLVIEATHVSRPIEIKTPARDALHSHPSVARSRTTFFQVKVMSALIKLFRISRASLPSSFDTLASTESCKALLVGHNDVHSPVKAVGVTGTHRSKQKLSPPASLDGPQGYTGSSITPSSPVMPATTATRTLFASGMLSQAGSRVLGHMRSADRSRCVESGTSESKRRRVITSSFSLSASGKAAALLRPLTHPAGGLRPKRRSASSKSAREVVADGGEVGAVADPADESFHCRDAGARFNPPPPVCVWEEGELGSGRGGDAIAASDDGSANKAVLVDRSSSVSTEEGQHVEALGEADPSLRDSGSQLDAVGAAASLVNKAHTDADTPALHTRRCRRFEHVPLREQPRHPQSSR